jgi:hypothetical protein
VKALPVAKAPVAERSIELIEYEQPAFVRGLLIFAPPLLLLVGALLFGGASRLNPIGLMITEALGVLALTPAILRSRDRVFARLAIAAIVVLALATALVLLQLVPLPPALWKGLPGREALANAVALIGLPNRWRPMSLAPDETQGAVLFLLAPAGMFLGCLQCNARERQWLVLAALCIALLSVIAGAVQMAGGAGGHAQFYAGAASGVPNGFFANRNHQAAFMIAAIGLSTALVSRHELPLSFERRPFVIVALMLLFTVSAAATLSFAGLLLLAPVLVVAMVILQGHLTGLNRRVRLAIPVVTAIGVAAAFIVLLVGAHIDRFVDNGMGVFGRAQVMTNVVAAGRTFQPVGSGLGTFDMVYRSVEPLDQIVPEYLNHVHNDYVELWLEGGWPAVTLIAAALFWWGFGAYAAWFGLSRADTAMARSGSLITAALLIQSVLDYPLRTPALAVVFAFACALMLPAPLIRAPD